MRNCILLIAVLAFACQINAFKVAQKNVTDMLTLTYIYGSDDAMLSHEEALEFCRDLSKNIKGMQILKANESIVTTTMSPTSGSTEAPVSGKTVERSDLLSIHDIALVDEMMNWIQSVDAHQFWIGGLVKLVDADFRRGHGREHIIQLWTDHTLANFRFIQYPNEVLDNMRLNQVNCLSVDYSSGKWGVHPCDTPMYFVCETVRIPESQLGMDASTTSASTTAIPSTTKSA
ncbi:hypothetical protein Ciccas_012500 [Cichlidogyrus casuarinus]|uniref:C-type lectin domain-containing protein n=1 Tax=Cichlidogyrus casuarinus TaxID=1844966 RepID=A0ABD2PT78_9PLAT